MYYLSLGECEDELLGESSLLRNHQPPSGDGVVAVTIALHFDKVPLHGVAFLKLTEEIEDLGKVNALGDLSAFCFPFTHAHISRA